ncbi:MAG: hypothetical protein V1866_03605 [archaeon]
MLDHAGFLRTLALNVIARGINSLDRAIGAINDIIVYEDTQYQLKDDIVKRADERINGLRIKMRKLNDTIRSEANNKQGPDNSKIVQARNEIYGSTNDVILELTKFINHFDEYIKRPELTRAILIELKELARKFR